MSESIDVVMAEEQLPQAGFNPTGLGDTGNTGPQGDTGLPTFPYKPHRANVSTWWLSMRDME